MEEPIASQELLRQNLNDSLIDKTISIVADKAGRKNAKKLKTNFEYKCKVCKKNFAEKIPYKEHMVIHSNDVHSCPICDNKYKCRKYLLRHIRNIHTDKKHKYKCEVCSKSFPFKAKLATHELVHTGEKPYECEVCGKTFRAQYSYKTHMLIHTNEKPFECVFCDYACRDNSTLRRHQERHLGITKLYECKKCSKTFKRKAVLKLHVAEAHLFLDVYKMECDLCQKRFKNRTLLRSHIRLVHERQKAMKCEICDKHLTNGNNMSAHLLSHTSAKPFPCNVPGCQKRFKTNGDMKKHRITHFPEEHHPCPNCGRRFSRRSRLEAHLRHHEANRVKNIDCDQCGSSFFNKSYLQKHIKMLHTDTRQMLRCDHCQFSTKGKPAMIRHLARTHTDQLDRECKICQKKFKRHIYLKLHYLRKHGIRYKMPARVKKQQLEPELVQIKEEPIDIEEHDVQEALDKAEVVNAQDIQTLHTEESSEHITEDVAKAIICDNSKDLQNVPEEVFDDHFVRRVRTQVPLKAKEDETIILKNKRKMEINEQLEEARKKDREVMRDSALQKLERARVDYNKRLKQRMENDRLRKEKDAKSARDINKIVIRRDKSTSGEYTVKSFDSNKEKEIAEVRENENGEETQGVQKETQTTTGCDISSEKSIFDFSQCYVCFKLFDTKEKLTEHCKEHFEVCSKKILKKCPLCPYVTSINLYRHMFLAHKVKVKTNYGRLIERDTEYHKYSVAVEDKQYQNGVVTSKTDFKEIEVIPSIKNLNKQASIQIDRKNREFKSRTMLKSRLVRKGKEWVVCQEKVDLNLEDFILPAFESVTIKRVKINFLEKCDNDDYIDGLMKLKALAKKERRNILAPCDLCDKMCRNIAAVKAHRKSHEKHPRKRRKRKYVKTDKNNKIAIENNAVKAIDDTNKDLKEFYKNNIKGSDLEFEQFVKIFKQIDKVDSENFYIVENNKHFGVPIDIDSTVVKDAVEHKAPKKCIIINKTKKAMKNDKFVRVLKISKKDYIRRLEIQNKLRENIAKNKEC